MGRRKDKQREKKRRGRGEEHVGEEGKEGRDDLELCKYKQVIRRSRRLT